VCAARPDDVRKADHWSVPIDVEAAAAAVDCLVRQRRHSCCSLSRSTSSPPRCPSPSATCSTYASLKATRRYRRASGSRMRPGQATSPTATYERSSRNLACHIMHATSTYIWPLDAAFGANYADSSLSWYPAVVLCQTATGLHNLLELLAPRDSTTMQSAHSSGYSRPTSDYSKTTINVACCFSANVCLPKKLFAIHV